MTTICQNCYKFIRGSGKPISHGLCENCWRLFYYDNFPKILLPANPSPCTACGFLETSRELFASEPKGYPVSFTQTSCIKRRGFCQLKGHYINFDEQEIITVKTTNVFTGEKSERRVII